MKRLAAKFRRSNAPKRELWTPAGSEDNLGLMHGDMELDATDPDRSQAGTAPASSYLITEPTGLSRYQLWLDIFLRSIRDWIIQQLHQERAQRGGFLWIPVLLGIGCAAYFNLPREPWTFAFPLLTLLLSILAGAMKRSNWLPVCLAMLLIAAGVSLAQIRTQMLSTIMLERSVIASITGRVERTEPRPQGRVRYTLSVLRLDGVKQVPERVRLTARQKDNLFEFGDVISGRARLAPPPGLALPGGYDFRFFSWYAGIGGSGFFLGAPHLIEPKTANNWSIRTWAAVTREHIANLLRQALPPQSSALATALIVGERSQIDEPINEALRRSGLAHILAISGLHMALVTLTVIGTVRLILASVPTLALKYPVKKIAGCFGLVSATFYLLLSGANLSTQRAYIMVVVLLLATLMDRRALTMRNVALAALVVLILAPEAVLQPGFQMSFAAAAALIATYEWSAQRRWRRSQPRPMPHSRLSDFKRQASRYISGLILVPLIAGMATGLYAGFHFYRIAPLGLLANVLAMPVVSLAVMPLALISVVLMLFGLEQLTLIPLGGALELVVNIAQWVTDLSRSQPLAFIGSTGQLEVSTLILGTLGLLIATLARSRLKRLSIPCFALMIGLATSHQTPDFIIAENGRQVGALGSDGVLALSRPRSEKFTTKIWRQAYRKPYSFDLENSRNNHLLRRCDSFGCVMSNSNTTLAHIHNTAHLNRDCLMADILVVPYEIAWACQHLPANRRPLIIDAASLRQTGALELYVRVAPDRQMSDRHKQTKNVIKIDVHDIQTRATRNKLTRPWRKYLETN
ncbi:MAG: DUF4131 domain-containing protein [Rhizobiaceae bacterium]|nr:DUF4131 domain-containing protein [Rhizobiaceae bacterium]